jgi:hypothetical protein
LSLGARFEVTLEGALFADGTMLGGEDGRRILVERRLRVAADLRKAQLTARRLKIREVTRQEVVTQMRAVESALKAEGERTSDQKTRAVLMIGTLVPGWIASLIETVDASCVGSCMETSAGRMEQEIGAWLLHLEKGLSEFAHR